MRFGMALSAAGGVVATREELTRCWVLPLAFTIPAVLAALAALPVLYWLLRLTPPPPNRAVLPTLAIVRDLEARQETPATHTLVAAAAPAADRRADHPGDGRSALEPRRGRAGRPRASARRDGQQLVVGARLAGPHRAAQALIETAGGAGRPVALRATAEDPVEIVPGSATRALDHLRSLAPAPHSVDRRRHESAILSFLERNAEGSIIWLSDRVSAAATV